MYYVKNMARAILFVTVPYMTAAIVLDQSIVMTTIFSFIIGASATLGWIEA